MLQEAESAADAVAMQLHENRELMERLGERLRQLQPRLVLTCARGSSDHAATFGKYTIERHRQIPTASFAPSMSSIYAVRQRMSGDVFIALSQSGQSPDLLSAAQQAVDAGAFVVAIVNNAQSPLANLADEVIPLHAGPELSVAATKSYLLTLTALLSLVANWSGDTQLLTAMPALPTLLGEAWQLDWQAAVSVLAEANNLFVIGRGPGFGIAQEAALKLKETCGLHAEAYSAAEVWHGPLAIVGPGFPVLLFAQRDESCEQTRALTDELIKLRANVILVGDARDGSISLPVLADTNSTLQPMLFVHSFYRMAGMLAAKRGFDPDKPPNLRKVTETH